MATKLPTPAEQGNANKVAGPSFTPTTLSPDASTPGAGLSPSLESEIHGSLARCLGKHKAETIAAECEVDRATIYKWAAKPSRVPLSKVQVLAAFDPDPEFLARVAGHLLSAVAKAALVHQAQGRSISVFYEFAPGKWGR